jgi:hypothetical protein
LKVVTLVLAADRPDDHDNSGKETEARAWSLIRNEKPIALFERNCHATEKSGAIACARSCRSSWLTGWWTRKEQLEKIKGQGGGEAQKKKLTARSADPHVGRVDRVTRLG